MHEERQTSLRTFFGCSHSFVNVEQVFLNPLHLFVYDFSDCLDIFAFAVAMKCSSRALCAFYGPG